MEESHEVIILIYTHVAMSQSDQLSSDELGQSRNTGWNEFIRSDTQTIIQTQAQYWNFLMNQCAEPGAMVILEKKLTNNPSLWLKDFRIGWMWGSLLQEEMSKLSKYD